MATTTDVPTQMHALQLISKGPAKEALQYNQVDVPKLKRSKDVLVQVKAIGVNPVEAKFRAGNIPLPVSLPVIIGGDYAGIIVQKGNQVTEFEVGDAVFGSLAFPLGPQGSYAEYVVVTIGKDGIAKKPDDLSFEDAAAAGIAVMTAYKGIVSLGELPETGPSKVVVIGASGGVGTYAVQIAKARGAEVIAICSGRNVELVKNLGADRVIDYTVANALEDFVKSDKKTVDLIFDAVGGDHYYNTLSPLLKKDRKKGIYSTAVGPIEHFGARKLGIFELGKMIIFTGISRFLFGAHPYRAVLSLPWQDFATSVQPLFANKSIKSVISENQVFELKDGAKAHELIETHRAIGKIVLRV